LINKIMKHGVGVEEEGVEGKGGGY